MNENENERNNAVELDLKKLALLYLKKWWLIVLCGLIAAGAALLYTMEFVTPTYTATISLFVNNTKEPQQVDYVSSANMSASAQLVTTYINIGRSDRVLDKVVEELGGDYTPEKLRSMLSAAKVGSTEIFQLSISDSSPAEATRVVNVIAEVIPDEIASIIEGSSARVIDYAKVPTSRSSPSFTKNTVVGGAVGVVIALLYLTIVSLMDIRVKDPQDLSDLYGLPVLGQIPDFTKDEVKSNYSSYGKAYSSVSGAREVAAK